MAKTPKENATPSKADVVNDIIKKHTPTDSVVAEAMKEAAEEAAIRQKNLIKDRLAQFESQQKYIVGDLKAARAKEKQIKKVLTKHAEAIDEYMANPTEDKAQSVNETFSKYRYS